MTSNQPFPSCSVGVSKVPNHSYGDEFDVQDNERERETQQGSALKESKNPTQK